MVKQTYEIDKGEPLEEVIADCQKAVDNGDFVPGYDSKQKERYKIFGVKKFKDWLLTHNGQPHYRLNGRSLKDLEDYMAESKKFERNHIFYGLVSLPFTFVPLFSHASLPAKLAIAGGITLFNIGYNVYPIMLQKYNQNRLSRVIERKKAKQNKK